MALKNRGEVFFPLFFLPKMIKRYGKMIKKIVTALFILMISTISSSYADINRFSFEAAYSSRYIWRGFDLIPNNYPAFQPSITYELGKTGLWINLWGSMGPTKRDITKSADEFDYSIGYDTQTSKGLMDLSVGFTYYTFPNAEGDNTSPEIFAGVTFSKLALSPSVTVYRDFDLGDGYYISGSISRTLDPLPLSIGASVGYNSNLFVKDSGISDVVISFSYELQFGKLTVTPSVHYAYIPMDAVNDENEFWTSFGINF